MTDAFALRNFILENQASDSGQRKSVDPVVAALPVNELNGQGHPASLRAPKYLGRNKTVHGQAVSAKYVPDQADTQSFRKRD